MDGKETILFARNGEKTILYLFSVNCDACSLNFSTWQNLSKTIKVKDDYINIIAISIDPIETTKKYLDKINIDFEIFSIQDINDITVNFRTLLTPQTILINEKRTVENVWLGVLNPYQIYSIIKRFS